MKVLVVKIDSHVAVRDTPGGAVYGRLMRYGRDSACCGTLAMLMKGSPLPAVRELAKVFSLDGRDRLGVLRDAHRVPPEQRALLAAVVGAGCKPGGRRPTLPSIALTFPPTTSSSPA
jgi:hypothetical protein